jgi:sterol desaturase/sphingolipid hydroxylase (fatty acid hydroxylase superfamily)
MLVEFLPLAFLAVLVLLMGADVLWPARRYPTVRLWRIKGVVSTIAFLALSSSLPLLWDGWLGTHRLFDLTGLGTWGGAVAGLLGYQLVAYWWHRAMHAIPFLWRFHQWHHSAERIDIFGTAWFHPFDMIGWSFMPSFALVMIFGVTAEAAVIAIVFSNVAAILGHANLRTPAWLGWFIQRPENHATHHLRGVHAYNYGDISLWDQIFGTWRNPTTFDGVGGYYDGASKRMVEMLLMQDVTEPPRESEVAEHIEHAAQSGSYAQ